MSLPGREDGAAPASGEPLDEFLEGLHDRFARYRPQGSNAWNFLTAFRHLEDAWGHTVSPGPLDRRADGAMPGPPAAPGTPRGLARRAADRMVFDRARSFVDQRVASATQTEGAPAEGGDTAARIATGFDSTLEALRFLSARVEALEAATAARRAPVAGMAWLEHDDAAGQLQGTITAALGAERPDGVVLHAECGSGVLLAALERAGLPARGVDPRVALALEGARRGQQVDSGDAADALGALTRGEVGAIVLSGVVDRAPLEDLCALLADASRALTEGAPLVVVSSGPRAVDGWAALARDLLPGRPLHVETWELLLERAGFTDVRRIADDASEPGGPSGGSYAVLASAPG